MQAQCGCAALPSRLAIVRHALRTGHYCVSKHVQGVFQGLWHKKRSQRRALRQNQRRSGSVFPFLKKALSPTSRFSTMVGDDEVSSMSKGYVTPNTQKNTDWAVKNFGTWRDQRNY